MGYYNIRLLPASQYMTKIVTECGKFRYNRVLMGTCASGDISRSKIDEMIGDIKSTKTYINDISLRNIL